MASRTSIAHTICHEDWEPEQLKWPAFWREGSVAVAQIWFLLAQGRILVFEVRDRKLHMLAEKETRGAVYSLAHFQVRVVPADVHYVLECSQSADPCAHRHFNPLLQRLLITVDVTPDDARFLASGMYPKLSSFLDFS